MWKKVDLSIVNYWSILRRRKLIFLFVFLVVFLIVILFAHLQKPIYRAVCFIKLIEPRSLTSITVPLVSPTHHSLVGAASKALTSKPIIEKVVYQLGLANDKTSPANLEKSILDIQRITNTKAELNKSIVKVMVDNSDAKIAANIANAIAETYIKVNVDKKRELARNASVSIEEQLTKAKQSLSETEKNLKEFKEQEGESVSGIALVTDNNMRTLEKQKEELIKDYPFNHPNVVKIKTQIEDLTKQLRSLPENEIKFLELTREYELSEINYRQLQSELEDASTAEKELAQDIEIISPAAVPQTPIKPNKKLSVIIAIIAGIIMGEFIAITAEAFRF